MNNKETGKIGETIASKFLIDQKYLILTRNHRERFDEIDIIARHRDGTLVFCEVKTIHKIKNFNSGFSPEDNLSSIKYKRMVRASNIFLSKHSNLIYEDKGWRVDLIAITLLDDGRCILKHYKNIYF